MGQTDDIHISRLNLYHDLFLDKDVIMTQAVQYEARTVLQRSCVLLETTDGMYVKEFWKGILNSKSAQAIGKDLSRCSEIAETTSRKKEQPRRSGCKRPSKASSLRRGLNKFVTMLRINLMPVSSRALSFH